MSSSFFNSEETARLIDMGIDTSLPIFPLSCAIASKASDYAKRLGEFDAAIEKRNNGGYETIEEHDKEFIRKKKKRFSPHRLAPIFPALIIGLIIYDKTYYALVKPIFPDLSLSQKLFVVFLYQLAVYLLIILIQFGFHMLGTSREVDFENGVFQHKLDQYNKDLQEADMYYDTYKVNYFLCSNLFNKISQSREALPKDYQKYSKELLDIYNQRRADNVADAIKVFEEIRHQKNVESQMAQAAAYAKQASDNAYAAAEAARQSQTTVIYRD